MSPGVESTVSTKGLPSGQTGLPEGAVASKPGRMVSTRLHRRSDRFGVRTAVVDTALQSSTKKNGMLGNDGRGAGGSRADAPCSRQRVRRRSDRGSVLSS